MKLFSKLYNKMVCWAQHRHASYYLAGVSFLESSFFPIPPDIMLAPMVLARPTSAWRFAALTCIASVLGGFFGYSIGFFAYHSIGQSIIEFLNLTDTYLRVVQAFDQWGVAIILLAGITPIPYKLFTIAAGVSHMALVPFLLASLVGRGFRFFLVTWLIKTFGRKIESKLIKHLDMIGWLMVATVIIAVLLLKIL